MPRSKSHKGSSHRSTGHKTSPHRSSSRPDSPAKVQRSLKGLDYPVAKDDLIDQARSNRAPREIMELLQELPGKKYNSPIQVMRAYGQVR